jgi:hypothetical protein
MISTTLNPTQRVWKSLIPIWQTLSIFFLWQSVWKVVYTVQIQRRECRHLLTNAQSPLNLLAEEIPGFIYIDVYLWVNIRGKDADGFHSSMSDDKDGHIPLPRIMFTCTALHDALLEWQKKKAFQPKPSKSKLKSNRPARLKYFKYKNDDGKIASCCAATGRKLLISPGIVDMYRILMNTWNTLPESYQQRVSNNILATVKHQIQQAENPTPAAVISMDAAHVDNAILLDYLTSDVALEESGIGSTDPSIPIDNNCMDDELHFGMPGDSEDYDDEGDEIAKSNAIPIDSRQRQAATELEMFNLRTSNVYWYEGDTGDNAEADKEKEASQADEGLTQTLED